jgi:outer membrane protein OmpA-like peptidoglycan-associated protein
MNGKLSALSLAGAMIVGGCSTSQPAALQQARNNLQQAQNDPPVSSLAAAPLYEATQSLLRAEQAWETGEQDEVKHLAYLTNQRIEIARKIAQEKMAEAELRRLAQEREQVLLAARTREAESARRTAQLLADQAQAARRQASLSKEEAQQARRDVLAKAREAENAKLQAEARARELELLTKQSEARLQDLEQAQRATEQALEENRNLQEQLSDLQARQTARGLELTLSSIIFDLDSATMKPGAERSMEVLIDFLKANPHRTIVIEGHTDSLGTAAYNQQLSEERAQAVKQLLEQNGIDANRITARGMGEEYPVASNQAMAGRQQNRRVEIVISSPPSVQDARTASSTPTAGQRNMSR